MSSKIDQTRTMLFLGRKTKVKSRKAYRLIDMHQLANKKETRGVKPVFSYENLSLEEQLDLAGKYNLCTKIKQ